MNILMLLSRPLKQHPRVSRTAHHLRDNGHEVTVLEWARHVPGEPLEEVVEGIPVHRVRNTRLMEALRDDLFRNPLWWRHAAHTAEALHVHRAFDAIQCNDLDTLPAGVLLKRRIRAKLLYDAHEIFSYMIEGDYPGPVATAAQALEDALLPSVDHLITVNEALLAFYRKRVAVPMTVVMNCPDPLPAYVPPQEEAFVLTYIGVLHGSRFFPEAVHALGDLAGVRFVIAGKREALYHEVEEAARPYANVEFLGTIPATEVISRTTAGHAILCLFDPTHRINQVGSPNKMYEAMATGRPIIVSRGTYSGTLVGQEEFGVVIDYSGEALREAVVMLRDHPETREAMGRRGLALAHRQYNWAAQAVHLLEAYETLE